MNSIDAAPPTWCATELERSGCKAAHSTRLETNCLFISRLFPLSAKFFSLTLFVTFAFPHWLKRAVFSIPLSSVMKPFGETSGQPCMFVMCLLADVINYDHAGVLDWSAPAAKFNSDAADFSTFFASSLVFLLSLRLSALTLCVPSTPCKKSCLFYFF